ncbi:GNAT family N-acetyltransferase [Halovivax gelatinilyticus]|uniref:GNAT family N-acetyltransferase n=1 Tax=Halovivax gelatinilyticus TaxID=2961597 RepID=UPI0020CA63BC|nr:GNAT family N-acetyltransferase [Halovivax gelatinilyticus]
MSTSPQPVVEPARADELDRLIECWLQLADEQRVHGSYVQVESNRSVVREVLSGHLITDGLLVAKIDDEIAGFVSFAIERGSFDLTDERGTVSNLWVDPQVRNRGIGRQLLEAAEAELADRGASVCQLEVLAGNESARRFYRRIGYEPRRLTLDRRLDDRDQNDTPSKVD